MENQFSMVNGSLAPLTKDIAEKIAQWEYEAPYEAYSIKGHHDEYLMDESTWGIEQFCLVDGGILLGQVSCQYEGDDLWVGWSMAPQFCGKGNGAAFVDRCVKELCRVKGHNGRVLLRVSARNRRAIKAYQKAGFRYIETIQDEIAYSDHIEDFWVMALSSPIGIREATTETDVATFWKQLRIYFKRDIFPDPEDENREYFLSDTEYRAHMQKIHDRPQDRCYYLFFHRDGQDIGFAMPVIFTTEDGKCFIMEYCIYPEFRGNGTGKACARVLLDWARDNGALYAELNYGSNERRRHFWETVGFVENGADEWGEPLMLLSPAGDTPITIEVLSDPEDWQLKKLENGFLKEIGEEPATEEKQNRLSQAIRDGKITFFMAKRGYRAIGMCSVAKCFSTFACSDTGVFDDFYIEPVFRKKGVARKLAQAAQEWCKESSIASLTVCCAPCDEGMYQALGFHNRLGATYAKTT